MLNRHMHVKLDQAAEGARARGASKIIGVDINPDKFLKGDLSSLMGIVIRIDNNNVFTFGKILLYTTNISYVCL